ncbi:hypothetical protein ABID21_001992 [Pseudorhizobium tarimense]|uniref:Uncharacterized protein n=1 Tax=Pseudorhizobium tarimense TaxID=1079109 RepID=A0ABV2H6I8_9HYPH
MTGFEIYHCSGLEREADLGGGVAKPSWSDVAQRIMETAFQRVVKILTSDRP